MWGELGCVCLWAVGRKGKGPGLVRVCMCVCVCGWVCGVIVGGGGGGLGGVFFCKEEGLYANINIPVLRD